ncbi:hypothetical protein FO519_002673 [Halicephalobus sp. NKZ332]|nr:hypothetical protein FO519_002673 [Halicephalobus sp. NKZ332]
MNRVTKIRLQNEINEKELELNYSGDLSKSWHSKYSSSAWIYVGSLPYDLNEGDIISVFSQYGEVVNINLIRDKTTGKSRGFCYLCYADQRSTVLAVDNFNGIKLLGRILQVDHIEEYRLPRYKEEMDEATKKLWEEGCAPKPIVIDEEEAEREAKVKERELKKQIKRAEKTVVKVKKEVLDEEFLQARKERKKREKEERKLAKLEKKLAKRLRDKTPDDERGRPEDEGRWDMKKKKLDEGIDDAEFYGRQDHFNFGKKRKELPPAPTHNIRPDFDKADWRDIEMFKAVREIERMTKGEKNVNWKEEEHYVPKRLNR